MSGMLVGEHGQQPEAVHAASSLRPSRVDLALMEARFVDASGVQRVMPWLQAGGELALEECRPVRDFPVLRGRRIAPGWWWAATSGQMVQYGFGAMRTQVMMLDRDPQVVALACRPVELLWRGRGGKVVSHAPHLMARLADGSGLLMDCASRSGAGRRLARRAVQVETAVGVVGWHYRLVGPPAPTVEANVRWLADYRHPRCAGGLLAHVVERFQHPTPLVEGVRALGDPIAVWPAVFHALWSGLLRAPLEVPLHERVVAVASSTSAKEHR
ncbi:TnsA-like heteromeric transposase endonuclease subunit [Streptomyces sp. NBC_01304]|uniref:TnsA-like heteromeric transposase endonuclease subunit n=1 Tax=Streptomyces sp. NBC_01304 TaxID=2903818 RepID=UPI002E117621|nr:TnsA-like heteromeric transposase endonuclease subunit [Streptomyces sp. NBC_01304]WSJ90862.1 TnsA-like heteromeric transposase endonuclease subunit [Streptomyces sp. NBC_01304]